MTKSSTLRLAKAATSQGPELVPPYYVMTLRQFFNLRGAIGVLLAALQAVLFLGLFSRVSQAAVSGELIMSQDEFVSEDFEATDRRSFTYLGAKLKSADAPTSAGALKSGFKTDVVGQYAAGAAIMSYLNVSELYWTDSGFSVGRRRETWSKLDSTWNMGLYEPLFKQNPLAPEGQGLTGLFLDVGGDDWGVNLFASFLFIPDQGPGYELKNGSFEKANPWFQTPPSYIHFYGQTDRVNYNIERPETNDIIFNRSFVGSAHLGKKDDGFFTQVALASKPSNQLALGFSGFLAANNTAQVQVNPKIYYHSLASADFSYYINGFNAGLSVLSENPKASEFTNDMTYAAYRPSTLVSPFVEFKKGLSRAQFSYLKVQGGEADLRGDSQSAIGSAQSTVLADRYPFREATLVKLATSQKFSKRKYLDLEADYLRGAANLFSIWSLEADYRWDAYWKASLKGQLVSALDTPEADRTVAGQFQNNDSIMLGVSYVF